MPELMTVAEFAKHTGMHEQTIYSMCRRKKLTHYQLVKHGRIMIPADALEELKVEAA